MTNRKEYLKTRYQNLKKQTNEYKVLLEQGLIKISNCAENRACKLCCVSKVLNNNFYIKLIQFNNNNYRGTYETICIACMLKKAKNNGKLFDSKIFEKQNNLRVCRKCKFVKPLDSDNFRLTQGKYLRRICLDCDKKEANESTKRRLVYARDAINASKRKYQANRRKKDPVYKLRKYTSTTIYQALRENGSSKKEESIMKYLPYTVQVLKEHLEKQFEPWMNWENIGKYNSKTWNDNELSTWTWNLDHIMPQSILKYNSMEDDNFQKAWALNNLRPYSAKLNVIEGDRKRKRI